MPFPGVRASQVGLFGLYLFAAFAWLGVAPALLGLGLLLGATALDPQARRVPLPKALWVVPLLALYWALSALWGITLLPGTGEVRWEAFKDLLWLLAFIPVAWWLRGDEGRLAWTGAVAIAGFLLGMATHIDAGILQGARAGFQVQALPFGLYSGTAILGLLLFPPRRKWVWPLWGMALAALVEGHLLTQARSAWLASALVLPIALALRYPLRSRGSRLGMSLALLIAGGVVFAHWPLIEERFDFAGVEALLEGRARNDASLSVSHRLWIWRFGMERWQEHPLLGWGIGASGPLLALAPYRFHGQEPFAHFHNAYLEVLVEEGLLGLSLWIALIAIVLGACWRSLRRGLVQRPLGIFLFGSFAMWSLWSLFDVHLTQTHGRFYWLLLMGAMYSFAFKKP